MKYHVNVAKASYLHKHITIKLTGRFVATKIDLSWIERYFYTMYCAEISQILETAQQWWKL